jgi:hypothetical protein
VKDELSTEYRKPGSASTDLTVGGFGLWSPGQAQVHDIHSFLKVSFYAILIVHAITDPVIAILIVS